MKRLVAVLVVVFVVSGFLAGCKKKEEQAVPRTPVTPQVPAQPGAPPAQAPAQTPASPHATAPKSEKPVVVPAEVKNKWNKVKLVIEDKGTKKKTEYTVKLNSEFDVPGTGLKLLVGEFLPDFKMDEGAITSASNELNNPAVRLEVLENGKNIFKGWLYVKFPEIHPFEHQKYSLTLKEAVKG